MQGHRHGFWGYVGASDTGADAFLATSVNNRTSFNQVMNSSVQTPIADGTNGTPRTGAETRPANMPLNHIIKF
jgi:hypothetical protein